MLGVALVLLPANAMASSCSCDESTSVADAVFTERKVVTDEAKGARAAVSADFNGDGLNDIVSASSTDNTVAWYRNIDGISWSGKNDITYLSNGARIVTTGDVDGDNVSCQMIEPARGPCSARFP